MPRVEPHANAGEVGCCGPPGWHPHGVSPQRLVRESPGRVWWAVCHPLGRTPSGRPHESGGDLMNAAARRLAPPAQGGAASAEAVTRMQRGRPPTPEEVGRAAVHCFLDQQTEAQIAQQLGIGRRTLARWKQRPEFRRPDRAPGLAGAACGAPARAGAGRSPLRRHIPGPPRRRPHDGAGGRAVRVAARSRSMLAMRHPLPRTDARAKRAGLARGRDSGGRERSVQVGVVLGGPVDLVARGSVRFCGGGEDRRRRRAAAVSAALQGDRRGRRWRRAQPGKRGSRRRERPRSRSLASSSVTASTGTRHCPETFFPGSVPVTNQVCTRLVGTPRRAAAAAVVSPTAASSSASTKTRGATQRARASLRTVSTMGAHRSHSSRGSLHGPGP